MSLSLSRCLSPSLSLSPSQWSGKTFKNVLITLHSRLAGNLWKVSIIGVMSPSLKFSFQTAVCFYKHWNLNQLRTRLRPLNPFDWRFTFANWMNLETDIVIPYKIFPHENHCVWFRFACVKNEYANMICIVFSPEFKLIWF